MIRSFFHLFVWIDGVFARIVELLVILILLFMGGITFLQVILRDVFHTGIPWAELGARHMVLWIAFLGAMLGTRARQHISIDIVTRMLPRRPRNAVRIVLDGVSCAVAFFLAKASCAFVLSERAAGGIFYGDIPNWWVQVVIPLGFSVIALEYAIGIVLDIWRIIQVGSAHTAGQGRKYIST